MPWPVSEYLLKGLYLGLLVFVALQEPSGATTALAAALTLGGLLLALAIGAFQKLRQGYEIRGRVAAFVVVVILDSPFLVYAGCLLGIATAAVVVKGADNTLLAICAIGGLALGVVFWLIRRVTVGWTRFALCLLLAAGAVAALLYCFHHFELLDNAQRRTAFGLRMLIGLPLFYLLTFAATAEETEIEIGGVCAALGLAMWMITPSNFAYQTTGLLLAAALYMVYTMRILPGLRVFKHVLRGITQARIGRYLPAFIEFRRALALDANNKLAREGLWRLHRSLDLNQLTNDPRMRDLVDYGMCLDRVSALLLEAGPTSDQLAEANKLLDLIHNQRPLLAPVVHYWRAVAATHCKQYDDAAAELRQVLDPSRYAADDSNRAAVLAKAWQLALTLHPELNRRVGSPELALPGRRMEAIGAVECHLAASPNDPTIWDLKRIVYSTVTEAEFRDALNPKSALPEFDFEYARQLGLALIHDNGHWRRGAEYLRIAAVGLPAEAPSILMNVAEAQQRAGQTSDAWITYEAIAAGGKDYGPKNLGDAEKRAYFSVVKSLAEEMRKRGDTDAAIAHYHLYTESVASGLETLRILADLYEQKGDVFGALRVVEQALLYNPRDKDILERKDRYYYSTSPDELRSRLDSVRSYFDADYCLNKSRSLIDAKNTELDVVDWGQHLAELAIIARPESIAAAVTLARAQRRRGEVEKYRAALEEIYTDKPTAFASSAEEDAWYLACRLLGDTYLNEAARPDLAVACFQAYRKCSKSGADTLFKLGQAYEQIGDRVRAAKFYEHVTAYDKHPLAPDAKDALYRLKTPG